MQVAVPSVVSLTWRLADAQGEPIDVLDEPIEFLVGGDDLLAKVEEALLGSEPGFSTELHLEPEHAFGEYDASLVFFEDRELFPDSVEPGMRIEGPPAGAKTPDLRPDAIYTVTEVYPEHVVLDGNHPLAGMALRLALEVVGVREATDAEVEAGTVGGDAASLLSTATPPPTLH